MTENDINAMSLTLEEKKALILMLEASIGTPNPMTTAGDIIVGGVSGAPARLAKGADGQVLKMVAGAEAWAADVGFANPMTTAGDIIAGGASGAAARLAKGADGALLMMVAGTPAWLAKGTDGQVLTMVAGAPAWV